MKILNILSAEYWKPLQWFSMHPFFSIKVETVLHTWIVLLLLTCLVVMVRLSLSKKTGLFRFSIIRSVDRFSALCTETLGGFYPRHITFIGSLFIFIFICNAGAIIPWFKEPTADLNTTLSLGLIAFFYNQWVTIQSHGLWFYITSYFSPFFIMLPLNIIGKLAGIVSIAFRLFGNIFGGATIAHIYVGAIKGSLLWEVVGFAPHLVILLFFGLFESFLQAFVFAMLSLTYLSIALQGDAH